jgi:zinc protease
MSGTERVLVVDKANAPQTMLLLGQVSVERSDPDYEKLDTMNQILGGLFSSRINLNLRERNGYTYGAFSAVLENRGRAPLIVGSSVRTDVTGPALQEMIREMHGMLAAEVTKEELDMAKESIARSLPARFETTQSIVGSIGNLYMYDLAPEYYEGLPGRIAALTPADVYASTQKHLKPDQMVVVAVGDRRTIEAQVKPLKLGPIAIRTPGKPVAAAASANP